MLLVFAYHKPSLRRWCCCLSKKSSLGVTDVVKCFVAVSFVSPAHTSRFAFEISDRKLSIFARLPCYHYLAVNTYPTCRLSVNCLCLFLLITFWQIRVFYMYVFLIYVCLQKHCLQLICLSSIAHTYRIISLTWTQEVRHTELANSVPNSVRFLLVQQKIWWCLSGVLNIPYMSSTMWFV